MMCDASIHANHEVTISSKLNRKQMTLENSTDAKPYEWTLMNNPPIDGNHLNIRNHPVHPTSFSRKVFDQGINHHQQTVPHFSMMTETDHDDSSTAVIIRVPKLRSDREMLETGYDTDGATAKSKTSSQNHHKNLNGYGHFVSPRLGTKQTHVRSNFMEETPIPHAQHPAPHNKPNIFYNQSPNEKHRETHLLDPSTIPHHDNFSGNKFPGRALRLVFIRHGERANQALGPDWFTKAFRTGTYQPYDRNLPVVLPRRNHNGPYEYDPPLTVNGLKSARLTGEELLSHNIVADLCISSSALRCIQTSERLLAGMDRRQSIPIRIEPGLFECPHSSHRLIDSFMTKKELLANGYNIKSDYKPLIQQLTVPESLEQYFQRSAFVIHAIIDRYQHIGGTIFIVSHAPGLLALTDGIKGIKPNQDTFYQTVSAYPPLTITIAEFDGRRWKHSQKPFVITSNA